MGLPKSRSPKPTARSMARLGERWTPSVIVRLRSSRAMAEINPWRRGWGAAPPHQKGRVVLGVVLRVLREAHGSVERGGEGRRDRGVGRAATRHEVAYAAGRVVGRDRHDIRVRGEESAALRQGDRMRGHPPNGGPLRAGAGDKTVTHADLRDRKSTRLNSSH